MSERKKTNHIREKPNNHAQEKEGRPRQCHTVGVTPFQFLARRDAAFPKKRAT